MMNPGPLSCPTAAAPACQPTGTPLAGQCATCSALNNTVCASQAATPVCIPASATCGCAKDSDCNADNYCDTTMVQTGTCKPGCRVVNMMTNCKTGEYCTKMDGSLGTCMGEPCNQNSDCTAPTGVCNTIVQPHVCVQCLNDPDCQAGQVCDAMNHCAECTTKQPQACMTSPNGPVCLASETCGCQADADCGNQLSGMVCDASKNKCVSGCRGSGGNGCPVGQMCSSTSGSIGTCQGGSTASGSTSTSSTSSASGSNGAGSGAGGAGAGGSGSGAGAGAGGGHVVSRSVGCGCRVGDDEGDHRLALAGLLLGLGLVARRRKWAAPR
jgi:MYXO-CTERM domain-containing protein